MKHLLIVGLLGTALIGCPVWQASVSSPPPSPPQPQPISSGVRPSQDHSDYAPLCNIEGGRYCHGCEDAGGCPQEDSGPLCCVGSTCVEWTGSHCSGILGWCFNYSTEIDPASGVKQATCHDEG